MLTKDKIVRICSGNLQKFKNIIGNTPYEIEGIFYSEMLLFVSLAKYFGVNLIIESGRARGQSTKIISECFKQPHYKIKSIESQKYSADVKVSYRRLKDYKNLKLIFGNSFDIIPKLITE